MKPPEEQQPRIKELEDDHDLTCDEVERLFMGAAFAEYVTEKMTKDMKGDRQNV